MPALRADHSLISPDMAIHMLRAHLGGPTPDRPANSQGTVMTTLAPPSTHSLDARSRTVAESLRVVLTPLVRQAAGAGARPSTLARSLDIDRTLAARILRAVRSHDSLLVLQEIPSPHGLRIFLDASLRAGISQQLYDDAADIVRQFEHLIHEFPGGRSALDAAVAAWAPEIRDRSERSAKQAVFKSMSCLLGYHAEATVSTVIIQPAANGQRCDAISIMAKEGLRRIRASMPITVCGRSFLQQDVDPAVAPIVETIDGRPCPHASEPCLLEDFCSQPIPTLQVIEQGKLFLYTLDESDPPINVPVTIASALVMRNAYARYRTDENHFEWEEIVPRIPTRNLIMDLIIRDDAFAGVTPMPRSRLYGLAKRPVQPDEPSFHLDQLDLSLPIEFLGAGRFDLRIQEFPRYSEMVDSLFNRVGWDRQRFRAFRCRVQYPVPLVAITHWLKLPEKPAS